MWTYLSTDFLKQADLVAFERSWGRLQAEDSTASQLLRLSLLVQSGRVPNITEVRVLAESMNVTNHLVALAFLLVNSGFERTAEFRLVMVKLIESAKSLPAASQRSIADLPMMPTFANTATPAERASVKWVLDVVSREGIGTRVFPRDAYTDIDEFCADIRPHFSNMLVNLKDSVDALDVLMRCSLVWGDSFEILRRLELIDPGGPVTQAWRGMFYTNASYIPRLAAGEPVDEVGQVPWEILRALRKTRSTAEFREVFRRFLKYPAFVTVRFGLFSQSLPKSEFEAFANSAPAVERLRMLGKSNSKCGVGFWRQISLLREGWNSAKPFFEECRPQVLAGFAVPGPTAASQRECVDLTGKNENSIAWCEVTNKTVSRRYPSLEVSDLPVERDTAVHVLLELHKVADARKIYDSYKPAGIHDYLTEQLLFAHEGKPVDVDGIRFAQLFVAQSFVSSRIAQTLWVKGRQVESCQVLDAMSVVNPYVPYPEGLECPEVEAAFKDFWGFDPFWTLPPDDVLEMIRSVKEK